MCNKYLLQREKQVGRKGFSCTSFNRGILLEEKFFISVAYWLLKSQSLEITFNSDKLSFCLWWVLTVNTYIFAGGKMCVFTGYEKNADMSHEYKDTSWKTVLCFLLFYSERSDTSQCLNAFHILPGPFLTALQCLSSILYHLLPGTYLK